MAKKNGIFLNYVSNKLVHTQTAATEKGAHEFCNVSIPMAESKTGYGSFSVNKGQVIASTKKDGTVNEGLCSILLGNPEKTRKVSIVTKMTKKGVKTYGTVEMTNAQIAEAWKANRESYRAALNAAAPAVATA